MYIDLETIYKFKFYDIVCILRYFKNKGSEFDIVALKKTKK